MSAPRPTPDVRDGRPALRVLDGAPSPGDTSQEASRPGARAGRDRPHRRAGRRSWEAGVLLTLVVAADALGLVMVLSSTSISSLRATGSPWGSFTHQLVWEVLGLVALFGLRRIRYVALRRWARLAVVVSFLALLAVLVRGVGVTVSGSARWLGVGQLRFQPSELAKLALVLFVADLLTRRAGRMADWRSTLRPVLLVLGLFGVLVLKQPDMGTTIVLVVIAVVMLFAAGTRLATLCKLGGFLAVVCLAVGWAEPYRRARLLSYLHPWENPLRSGYQLLQSLVGLAGGGVLGTGLGNGPAKWGALPNASTDFIFSVIGQELGLAGSLATLGIFVGIAWCGLRIAARASNRFGTLLATGITAWLVGQAAINIAAVIGVIPVTGVPLPFISLGGSSLVIELAAVGILLNVADCCGAAQSRQRRASATGAARSADSVVDGHGGLVVPVPTTRAGATRAATTRAATTRAATTRAATTRAGTTRAASTCAATTGPATRGAGTTRAATAGDVAARYGAVGTRGATLGVRGRPDANRSRGARPPSAASASPEPG